MLCRSSGLRKGSKHGASPWYKEDRAVHSSLLPAADEASRCERASQAVQQAQLCCCQHCWEQRLGMGESKYLDRRDVRNVPPYLCVCLCVIFMLIRKFNYSFQQAAWAMRIASCTWSSSWGWCVHEQVCLHSSRRCVVLIVACRKEEMCVTAGTERKLQRWCKNWEDSCSVCAQERGCPWSYWVVLFAWETSQIRGAVCRE